MELEFTAEQEELRETVRGVLAKESPVSLARSVVEEGTSPDDLWSTMVGLGWPSITIPESAGGVELTFVEAGIIAEELGRVIAPGPWLTTVTQFAAVIRECASPEQTERWLRMVADGEVRGTLAIAEPDGSFSPESVESTVTSRAHDVVLSGRKRFVMDGGVDEIVVVAREPGSTGAHGVSAVVVPVEAVARSPIDSLDATRRLVDLELNDVEIPGNRVIGDIGAAGPGLARGLEQATVALALEMVGTCRTVFDITLEYAKQREQFGAPIGSFQAVKHKLADMMVSLERARATAYFASLTIAEDDERRAMATSVAKAAAGDCQRVMSKEGIQLHGGIGVTWEHDMHLYVKRLKGSEPLFGGAGAHRQRIADLLGV